MLSNSGAIRGEQDVGLFLARITRPMDEVRPFPTLPLSSCRNWAESRRFHC